MPCVKRPTKKSRGASSSMEPPSQDHPLAQWFYNKEDFGLYLLDFAPRKVVPPSELSAIWRLNYDGEKVESGNTSEEFRRNYSKENACTMFNVPFGTPKPTVGLLSVEHRLLHFFLTYVLVPQSGNHGLILDEDLEIMWRMVNGQQINWVHLIVTHMRRTKPGNSKGLPYAILWTAIFKYVDLMQAIQNMELNMTQRMERIERNQPRMLRKIRRVEAYTFDEDEAEDDDDDLDWS
ncbi:hypothetical protein PIB30_097208 [Stylosanthes scabra]|uniref:Uncharacterized protein n=1 Tax=Stylosanthes scabra TaxID=79078 RepID=A0ABU6YUF0_9FABA|nr:hypothetical protein [Stylosanthes scabra]